jgi:hypothetical protein
VVSVILTFLAALAAAGIARAELSDRIDAIVRVEMTAASRASLSPSCRRARLEVAGYGYANVGTCP